MTEIERLTLQRFAAIRQGSKKGIPRFYAMNEHLLVELPAAEFEEMDNGTPSDRTLNLAAAALAKIDRGDPLSEMTDIPKFLRRGRSA